MGSEAEMKKVFSYYPRLERVREFVAEHITEPIRLEDAAEVALLEPKYFSKFFKDKTGTTFSLWLQEQRIEKAKDIIEKQEISISCLAQRVGYTNTRTFLRAFRRRTGASPSVYRKWTKDVRNATLADRSVR